MPRLHLLVGVLTAIVTVATAASAAPGLGTLGQRVARGFEIAPVPLNLAGLDRDLVGLGSYLVNAAGGCNDCHTNPPYAAGGDPFDLGDIFSDLFGPGFGGARTYSRMRGRDIRFTLDIDFLDSINGAKRRISLAEGRTLDVAIPAGVETGQVLRLKNQGGAGVQGGPAGDALVELRVRPHSFFRREGQDVHTDLSISLTEAVEGARIQAPTPGGNVTLTIPAGSNTGKVLRLKGKGVAGQGDQFVRLQVVIGIAIAESFWENLIPNGFLEPVRHFF